MLLLRHAMQQRVNYETRSAYTLRKNSLREKTSNYPIDMFIKYTTALTLSAQNKNYKMWTKY